MAVVILEQLNQISLLPKIMVVQYDILIFLFIQFRCRLNMKRSRSVPRSCSRWKWSSLIVTPTSASRLRQSWQMTRSRRTNSASLYQRSARAGSDTAEVSSSRRTFFIRFFLAYIFHSFPPAVNLILSPISWNLASDHFLGRCTG